MFVRNILSLSKLLVQKPISQMETLNTTNTDTISGQMKAGGAKIAATASTSAFRGEIPREKLVEKFKYFTAFNVYHYRRAGRKTHEMWMY